LLHSLRTMFALCWIRRVDAVVRDVWRADPGRWSSEHVQLWLQWAVHNFSFDGVDMTRFDGCSGTELLEQGRDSLLQRAPLYVGDILWEHLDILQKGEH